MDSNRVWILMGKKKSGEASIAEIQELEALLANNEKLGYSGEVIDQLWNTALVSPSSAGPDSSTWTRISFRLNGERSVTRTFKRLAVAAVLLLMAGAGTWYFIAYDKSGQEKTALTEISTKVASKTKMQLPDGTQVWINGNSQLVYNAAAFGKANREVNLTGEAFFDVAKSAAHPFIIHAGKVNITVLGTAFNVKAYPDQFQVETSLLRGLVELTTKEDPDRKILLKPDEKIIIPVLKPSDIQTDKKEKGYVSPYSIIKLKADEHKVLPETVWMNKKLEFDNESFAELAPKLESWYSVNLHFEHPSLKAKRFSGLIENESLIQTLEAMKLSFHFVYRIKDNEVTISLK